MALKNIGVEFEEGLMEEAQGLLVTTMTKDTIHQAIETLRQQALKADVSSLKELKRLDLANEQVMAGAWRS